MTDNVVACADCTYRESFPNLGRARVALDDHESESGHRVEWEIRRVADGRRTGGRGRRRLWATRLRELGDATP